eukprot:3964866-Ditylum_brightwellii.AAC.1
MAFSARNALSRRVSGVLEHRKELPQFPPTATLISQVTFFSFQRNVHHLPGLGYTSSYLRCLASPDCPTIPVCTEWTYCNRHYVIDTDCS